MRYFIEYNCLLGGNRILIKTSWTKLLTFGPLKDIENPFTFWKTDELLMVAAGGRATTYNSKLASGTKSHKKPNDYGKTQVGTKAHKFLWDKTAEMRESETPEDRVVEILSKLPPKSLIRFKCIRKSWCTIINSPIFGKFELDRTFEALGFGYDCKAKEYKVVQIIENCEYSDDEQTFNHCITLPHTAETFHRIQFPSRGESDFTFFYIFLRNESLASFCSHYDRSGDSQSCEIWVMDDYDGVKSSWTKLLTVGPLQGIDKPLTFWKSDELLMLASDGRTTSYNSSTGSLTYVHVPPILNKVVDFQALIYVESIVPLK
ncbi:unnamed protein product [Malus baccata var. baccata]